jgi:hypothetical protein
MLVLQTLLMSLALTAGVSTVILRGGMHVDMSPSYDYMHDVWLPTLARLGVRDVQEQAGVAANIEAAVLKAACPGSGLYLTALRK